MASTTNYLDPRVLASLQGLALRTRHVMEGYLAGAHRGAHPGASAEYSQHRPYVAGDDLRQIDWKAFGRTDRLYVKQFMDETNLACTFLLDASASMSYQGTRSPLSKFQYASCLVAALAWLIRDQGDAAGLSVFDGPRTRSVPSVANEQQLPEIIRVIESVSPHGNSETGLRIRQWASRTDRQQLVVVASDLFGDETTIKKSLVDLRRFGHEVIVFQICDRDETDFPFDDLTAFRPLESGPGVTLDAELYREGYLRHFQAYVSGLRDCCSRSTIDFVTVVTDEQLGQSIGRFLTARRHGSVRIEQR